MKEWFKRKKLELKLRIKITNLRRLRKYKGKHNYHVNWYIGRTQYAYFFESLEDIYKAFTVGWCRRR